MNKIIFTEFEYQNSSIQIGCILNDGKTAEIQLQPCDQHSDIDSIYMAKVENIAYNIDAAFVLIKPGVRCYLPFSKCKHIIYSDARRGREPLRVGDELIVQITRDAMKGKLPSVSADLSIRGKYMVLTTDSTKICYSSKLSKADRLRIAESLENAIPVDRAFGMIVRTNAAEVSAQELHEELNALMIKMQNVIDNGPHKTCFSKLYEPVSFMQVIAENARLSELEEIVTDLPDFYQTLCETLPETTNIRLYQDKLLPLYKLYNLESEINEIYHEKVWLNSGAFLVIQQTEAFVSIDVNSGKYLSKKKAEEGYRKINLEAAKEIARQLRLRNLSGIILIDFINMENPDHNDELFHVFQRYLKMDPIPCAAVDITALNIMEVTRKKVRRPLIEDLKSLNSRENF